MSHEEILTASQVAEILGVTTKTLAYWRSCGEGPTHFVIGTRTVRYRRSDLDRWLAASYELTAA